MESALVNMYIYIRSFWYMSFKLQKKFSSSLFSHEIYDILDFLWPHWEGEKI